MVPASCRRPVDGKALRGYPPTGVRLFNHWEAGVSRLVSVAGPTVGAIVVAVALMAAPSLAVTTDDSPSPDASSSAQPTPSASATATKPPKVAKPIPATKTTKAKHVPWYPTQSKERGKRIVYDKALMTIWLINSQEEVVARYPVVGRSDRPPVGVFKVYSKSERSANRELKLTFNNMVRFYPGSTGAAIGFHDIPRTYAGTPIHGPDKLGLPLGIGGCVRMTTAASGHVYRFARIGTRVEVL